MKIVRIGRRFHRIELWIYENSKDRKTISNYKLKHYNGKKSKKYWMSKILINSLKVFISAPRNKLVYIIDQEKMKVKIKK